MAAGDRREGSEGAITVPVRSLSSWVPGSRVHSRAITLVTLAWSSLLTGLSVQAAAQTPVTLEWWPLGERDVAEQMVKAFQATHPHITIKIFFPSGGWEERWEKLHVAYAGGVAPDVVRVKEYWITDLAEKGMILPLDDYLRRDWNEIKPEPHYYQSLLKNNNAYRGRIYGLPAHNFWPMLHYNQRLFDNAGIPEPPQTWAEFHQQLRGHHALPGHQLAIGPLRPGGALRPLPSTDPGASRPLPPVPPGLDAGSGGDRPGGAQGLLQRAEPRGDTGASR